jgi:hypothetical protein
MKIRQRSIAAAAALTIIFIPALVACSDSAELAAEQIAENAIGGDVDIEEGNVRITDEQGNEIVAGTDVALPANWPLPIPDSGSLVMATVQTDGTAYGMWVMDGSAKEVADDYGQLMISAGYALNQETNLDGAIMRDYSAMGMFVSVVVGETDGETTIAVTGLPE